MRKALAVAGVLYRLFRHYPAMAAGAASLLALCLAGFGFNVSSDTILAIAVPLTGATAAVVHILVTPTAKLEQEAKAPDGGGS